MENKQINLFDKEVNQELLVQTFGTNWYNQLRNYIDTDDFKSFINKIERLRTKKNIFPISQEMFKAFRICDFNDIRVIILGQDPYHNGNADGLAFSCKIRLSSSLSNIFQTMEDDLERIGDKQTPYVEMNLEYLAKQGILLTNTCLTVEESAPLAHKNYWNSFMFHVFNSLNKKDKLVWCLWGRESTRFSKLINKNHLVLEASHPASASYNNTVWKCNHFSKTNEYLRNNNLKEIQWI